VSLGQRFGFQDAPARMRTGQARVKDFDYVIFDLQDQHLSSIYFLQNNANLIYKKNKNVRILSAVI
jgi:hypothetical protein